MHRDGERLYHRALVEVHSRAELSDLLGVHGKVFACRAGSLETHHLQLFAEIVFSVAARMALPAHDLRLDRHLVADGEPFYTSTERRYFTRDLVALRDGI